MNCSSKSVLVMLLLWASTSILVALDLKNPPQGGVYDPSGFLDQNFVRDIEYSISYERQHRQFEVFVIIFEEEPSQGAGILAKQAGESWSEGKYWTVIFQVGPDAEPDCVVGGDLMARLPEKVVDRTMRGARGTALLVSTPQNRLREMVRNLADSFGFLYIRANEAHEEAVKIQDRNYAFQQKRKGDLKALGVVLLVSFIGLLALMVFLWKKYFRKLKPIEFPHTSPRRRLAAPFSGGGDVLVKYGKRH